MTTLDHIVYCVPNLHESIAQIESKTGIKASIGGRHLSQGTHNALIRIGEKAYLEILAIDYDNKQINSPRWMGIDLVSEAKITRWCVQSNKIKQDAHILKTYNDKMGNISKGERETPSKQKLQWQMTLPLPSPEVELAPFLIDWSNSDFHPADDLKQNGHLSDLEFHYQNKNEKLESCLASIYEELVLKVNNEIKITATLKGPKGSVKI